MSSNINKKIIDWHERAKQEKIDYFVKFTFDYLAFVASINNYYSNPQINQDRNSIQNLKQDQMVKSDYLKKLDNTILQEIIDLLKIDPIKNVTRPTDNWWDCDTNSIRKTQSSDDGKIKSSGDYINMVEFIYRARNNLFHGQKGPDIHRDTIIMKYGSYLLNNLLEAIIKIKGIK